MSRKRSFHSIGILRAIGLVASVILVVTLLWWTAGRLTLEDRRVTVQQWGDAPEVTVAPDSILPIRILAWNIAHGRGDAGLGVLRNWRGGDREMRIARLGRIAETVERVDPDILVLNEVDFDAHWSGGLNQAEFLARLLGYPVRVEQVNYDVRFPFGTLSFGNAVLTRFPVEEVEWVSIPPHAGWEAGTVGAKGASVVRLNTPAGRIALVPVHLEVRSEETRRAAVPVLDSLRRAETAPMILAGDFNSSPQGWFDAEGETALGDLLEIGWRSPRAEAPPDSSEWSYSMEGVRRAIDWVLVEPPLEVVEAELLEGVETLSDHLPVFALVRFDPTAGEPAGGGDPEGDDPGGDDTGNDGARRN